MLWTICYRLYLAKLSFKDFLKLFITQPAVRKYLPPPSHPLPPPPPPHHTPVADVVPPPSARRIYGACGPADAREKKERQITLRPALEKIYSPSPSPSYS